MKPPHGANKLRTYFEGIMKRKGLKPALAHLQAQKLLYQQDLRRGRLSKQQVERSLESLDEVAQELLAS